MLTIDNLVKSFEADKRTRKQAKAAKVAATARRGDATRLRRQRRQLRRARRASCSRCSARPAAARRRRCAPSRAWRSPTRARISVGDRVLFDVAKGERTAQRAGQRARPRHGVPVLRDLAAHVGLRQRRLPAAGRASAPSGRARPRSPSGSAASSRSWSSVTYADRQATKLSGGQQQRLALARALVTQPPLLLLDEPLSNLDAKLRESLRFELKRLQRELGITSIYVTHDQVEALALSSQIAVMRDGEVVQLGKPREIYEQPQLAVRRRVHRHVELHQRHRRRQQTARASPSTPPRAGCASARRRRCRSGSEAIVSIRPEAVEISRTGAGRDAAERVDGRGRHAGLPRRLRRPRRAGRQDRGRATGPTRTSRSSRARPCTCAWTPTS